MPNQHGAWAMLTTPFLVGVLSSEPRWVHLPLAALWAVGYFAFFATGLWLKSHRRARYLPPVRAYAAASLLLGALVLALRPDLSPSGWSRRHGARTGPWSAASPQRWARV